MSNKLISLLQCRREELAEISPSRTNWPQILQWHSRTRPMMSQYFVDHLSAFDDAVHVRWKVIPRVRPLFGESTDNSRNLANERSANDQTAVNQHRILLAHMDALIELQDLSVTVEPDTQESDSIFAELDLMLNNSLMPQQFKSVVSLDLHDAQMAYGAGAFKACVVMLGATLEGVMLGTLQRADILQYLAESPNAPRPIQRIGARNPALAEKIGNELSFEEYKVCIHELVPGAEALGVDNIQSFRNAIHPWKSIQEPARYGDFDRARALHYVASLKKIVESLCQWRP